MIIVIGKSGQLAQELRHLKKDVSIKALGRDDIDLNNLDTLAKSLSSYAPKAIINAAAYTAVDKAENDKIAAFQLNAEAVQNLALYCQQSKTHFVHISTDYVFDGNYCRPILANEKRRPLGIYGASKAKGEELLETLPDLQYCIIRTAWVYSKFGSNFVHTMLRLMREKPLLNVVDDQIGTPTWARGLADACLLAATENITGIHHWTDLGVASWYDFAVAIQQIGLKLGILDKQIPINPVPSSAFPTVAKRPPYSVLDKQSLSTNFSSISQAHWRTQLELMMESLAPVNFGK